MTPSTPPQVTKSCRVVQLPQKALGMPQTPHRTPTDGGWNGLKTGPEFCPYTKGDIQCPQLAPLQGSLSPPTPSTGTSGWRRTPLRNLPRPPRISVPLGCDQSKPGRKFAPPGTEAAGSPWTPRLPGLPLRLPLLHGKLEAGQLSAHFKKSGALGPSIHWTFIMA